MPRKRVTEETVYQFDELSEQAKEKARDWFRQGISEDFADFSAEGVIEDAERMAKILGINLSTRPVKLMNGNTRYEPNIYWSIGNRDDGASFAGSYAYTKGTAHKMAEEAPAEYDGKPQEGNTELNRIAQTLQEVQRRNFYQLQASIGHGRHFHMDIDVERADGKEVSAEDCEIVAECLRDFASWIHRQLEREYEYRISDEAVDEDIRSNEYEFDEDGNRI